jgi:hypothetical protein
MSLKKIKIKNKKSIGVKPVYDICVPGAHHYLLDSGVVSHNSGFIYASSIVIAMKKLKLKEDEDGNKTSQVHGIRAACKVMKTRYSKPFESVQIKIPYDTGMDRTSGLLDLFEQRDVVSKTGNKLLYVSPVDGTEIKMFRKQWENNMDGALDRVMAEFHKFTDSRAEDVDPEEVEEMLDDE